MKCKDIMEFLNKLAPLSYAESWDNVGLLVGDNDKEVNTIFLAVDATDRVLDEACEAGADMLITHHPLIFSGLKSVNEDHFVGRRVRRLIREDICYCAMHTNFDIAGDMAGIVVARLPFWESKVLCETADGFGLGRIGLLEKPMCVGELVELIKKQFDIPSVVLYGNQDQVVERIAVLPGSGKSEIKEAIRQCADVMVTGDIDHHVGIDALAEGMILIDAGHYGLEKVFVEYMKHSLEKEWGGTICVRTEQIMQPFTVL